MFFFDRLAGSRSTDMDVATLAGAVCAFGLVFLAISLSGGLASFWDVQSILIVLGGTIGATLITFPLEDFQRTFAVLRPALFLSTSSAQQRLNKIIDLAKVSRAEGELSLENYTYYEPDPFLRKCIELVVDRIAPDETKRILEIEVASLEDRHRRGAQLFQTMGAVAPAMGMVGTLIGLVRMLENLQTPEAIGPAMAVAILTTFYGAILAYILFLPLAAKLRMRSEEEQLIKQMTIEGILCISEGMNPRLIESRLQSFLPPEQRYSRYK